MDAPARDPAAMEQELLEYLEECYGADTPISPAALRALLAGVPRGSCAWSLRSEDGLPLLHLAVMNEATEPADMMAVVGELLAAGAPPAAKDEDGDTALEAVLTLAADAEADDDGPSDLPKRANMAAVQALLRCPELTLERSQVFGICAWLRRHMPKTAWADLIRDLEARVGKSDVNRAWSSEQLLEYLERLGYDEKRGVEAAQVKAFIDRGAWPSHSQNGATALLMVVLNPYSSYSELMQVFPMMIRADPASAATRDGFKLAPMQWAADYANVAAQHGLQRANPATLLALLPAILAFAPPEVDAGEVCLKVAPDGRCLSLPQGAAGGVPPRFLEGHRVVCRVEAPGGAHDWEEGVVVGLWYREPCWPREHPGAPYEVLLDIGARVFALADDDRIIRAEAVGPPRVAAAAKAAAPAAQGGRGAPKAKAKAAGKRFQRRQKPDGDWELLDTVSGKARPCSPPSSDDEG